MEQQAHNYPDLKVPFIVHFCCEKVFEFGGKQSEGIFRISVDSEDLEKLVASFDRGNYSFVQHKSNDKTSQSARYDPNDPAVLLKYFLRHLPEPLIPPYDECIQIAKKGLNDPDLDKLFESLPKNNQELLIALSLFFAELSDPANVAHTKMTLEGLAVVIVPLVFRSTPVDYATAMMNTKLEQDFVVKIVEWIVRTKKSSSSVDPKSMKSPQRSPCGKGLEKKRKSTSEIEDVEEDEEEDEEDDF